MPTDDGSPTREPRSPQLAQIATEMLEAAGLGGGDPEEAQTVALIGIGYAILAVRAELALFDSSRSRGRRGGRGGRASMASPLEIAAAATAASGDPHTATTGVTAPTNRSWNTWFR
jgi:hypothetical protein